MTPEGGSMQTWDYLAKRLIWEQLSFVHNCRVLDFGSGDGATAEHFAVNNDVTAVEPSQEMLKERHQANYKQLVGSLDCLAQTEDGSFDVVTCHNVLEYVDDRQRYLSELCRVLKPGGTLSIVKHNRPGRVMQMCVLLNRFDEALHLLDGGNSSAQRFGAINYYDDAELLADRYGLSCERCCGLRVFWDLQQNQEIQSQSEWQEKMLSVERAVAEREPYRSIAFFHHLILRKK